MKERKHPSMSILYPFEGSPDAERVKNGKILFIYEGNFISVGKIVIPPVASVPRGEVGLNLFYSIKS